MQFHIRTVLLIHFKYLFQWLSDALNTNNHTYEVAPVFIMVEKALLEYTRKKFGWKTGDGKKKHYTELFFRAIDISKQHQIPNYYRECGNRRNRRNSSFFSHLLSQILREIA